MILIDGKKVADEIKEDIRNQVENIKNNKGKIPHLAAIIVGNDGGSLTYVAAKVKACQMVGFESTEIKLPETITENELLNEIEKLNSNSEIDGFIVQLPLPKHISEQKIAGAISPKKDVDGFHPVNTGRMMAGLPTYLPATPFGILELLKNYKIETKGKHCVIIGRSNIVGTPMSVLMSRKAYPGDCTVSICHSQTTDIKQITLQADIIIVAMGVPEFLKGDMVKQGAVVIDVGTTRVKSETTKSGWKLMGDVHFESVAPKCSFITPVPGGVGPMTITALLTNTLLAAKKEIYTE